tara:strand:+ start:416 stop:1147 length:732 start_codon:yes stop_codon:yes gene_type:complete
MPEIILDVKNLRKSYKKTSILRGETKVYTALDDISFKLSPNEVLGLIGHNGAGKTTLLKILALLIKHDSGDILFNKIKKNELSLVSSNERSFFWRLTLWENLEFFYKLYGLNKEIEASEITKSLLLMDLMKKKDTTFMALSSGEKKRAMISRSLIKKPKLILFDEACNSLDLFSRENLMKIIKERIIGIEGTSVIWATHSLNELDDLCDKVLWLEKGRVKELISKELVNNNFSDYIKSDLLSS